MNLPFLFLLFFFYRNPVPILIEPGTCNPHFDISINLWPTRDNPKEFLLNGAAHSVLHLLGYDHERGGIDRVRMREKEEQVMTQLGLPSSSSYVLEEDED